MKRDVATRAEVASHAFSTKTALRASVAKTAPVEVTKCEEAGACAGANYPVCELAAGECVACLEDDDCGGTAHCIERRCEAYDACSADDGCAACTDIVCAAAEHICIEGDVHLCNPSGTASLHAGRLQL